MRKYGYTVDKQKYGWCRDGSPDSYCRLGRGYVKPGEFISESKLRELRCSKSEIAKLLVPVSIDSKNLSTYGDMQFPKFGCKYSITDNNYKPNRFNSLRYNNYKH